jgi:DNA modification methylase
MIRSMPSRIRSDKGVVDNAVHSITKPLYQTKLGRAYLADSLPFIDGLEAGSVNLAFTSPPYALHFKKEYGNADQRKYVEWLLPFARGVHRLLRDDGSFVIDIGGAWTPGTPTRSLYHFEVLLALVREVGFYLAQEFYWYQPCQASFASRVGYRKENQGEGRSQLSLVVVKDAQSQGRQPKSTERIQPGYAPFG